MQYFAHEVQLRKYMLQYPVHDAERVCQDVTCRRRMSSALHYSYMLKTKSSGLLVAYRS